MKTKSLTKVTLLSIFVMSVITAVTLNSCQKESIKPKTATTTKATAAEGVDAVTSTIMNEINNLIFSSSKNQKGLVPDGGDTVSCMTRTFDTINKPYSYTLNYGSNCVGSDGKTRSGMVTITYDNSDIRVVNNVMSVTFQNYSVSGATYNGSIALTNNGPNGNGNQVISEVGSFVCVSNSNQGTDSMSMNLQCEWLAGENSSPAANWQFSITGAMHSGTSTGNTADITITSALIRNAKTPGCNYYIQGTEQIAISSQPVEYIDFGNPGACSGQKSVTQNGVTTVVSQ